MAARAHYPLHRAPAHASKQTSLYAALGEELCEQELAEHKYKARDGKMCFPLCFPALPSSPLINPSCRKYKTREWTRCRKPTRGDLCKHEWDVHLRSGRCKALQARFRGISWKLCQTMPESRNVHQAFAEARPKSA